MLAWIACIFIQGGMLNTEERLLGLETCQLQILGLETFGELREAKMMRLRLKGGQGKGEVPKGLVQQKVRKMVGES